MSNNEISASDVMKLREQTGAGMMDCKKALTEARGDVEKAIDILRQKGLKKSAEKATRVANQGIVLAAVDDARTTGVLIEINCETDFVAKNADFIAYSQNILKEVLTQQPKDLDAFLAAKVSFMPGKTVADTVTEMTAKIGERIVMKRFAVVRAQQGLVTEYIHPGNKLAVLVELGIDKIDAAKMSDYHVFARDIAMQVAAMNPQVVSRDQVAPDVLARETEIFKEQARQEGKPEKILDNIVKGRVEKYYQEICLLEQAYVKDASKTIKDFVQEFGKKVGQTVTIQRFERFRLGD